MQTPDRHTERTTPQRERAGSTPPRERTDAPRQAGATQPSEHGPRGQRTPAGAPGGGRASASRSAAGAQRAADTPSAATRRGSSPDGSSSSLVGDRARGVRSHNTTSAQVAEGGASKSNAATSGAGGVPAALSRKPASFYIAIAVAVLALIVAAVLAFALFAQTGAGRDPNAAVGQLEGKTQEEIQAELDRIVEEGMFNISIASTVQLEDGTSEAELRIENVPNNPYLMKVEITRDDTGETIYTSGLIEPNHHIQKAKLDVDLDAGDYPCTAVFYAHDKEDEQLIGQAAAKLTVSVLN